MSSAITTVLIVLFVSFLMRYLGQQSRRAPKVEAGGLNVLTLPIIYEIIAWFGLVFSAFLATVGFLFNSHSTGDRIGWLGIFAMSAVFAIPLIVARRNTQIAFDEDKIVSRNTFLKQKTIYWKDIKSVEFNKRTLVFRDGNIKIGVGFSMIGFESLVNAMKEKLDLSMWESASEKIDKFYRTRAR